MTRVRFAPSPTGDLHVGGLRTALYNYLYARKTGGVFVLRIEDTDRERHVSGATDSLIEMLGICGLTPDEGPGIGGDYGPYIQSERLDIYHEAAQQLIDSGNAYPCFCSQERLDQVRKEQQARGETAGYDRKCRALDKSEALKRMESEPYVIRLAVPLEGEIKHYDLVWGEVDFPLADVDDQVLMKSDGFPTYHLANVVDDASMEITHVIRGEEWLISVPKHLLLYRFLGIKPPKFAHLPLILNQDRQKLSKREGAGSVAGWLERGILPQALINYIAFLGWNPGDDREIFNLKELTDAFQLKRVNRSGSVFDPTKLGWIANEHFKRAGTAEIALLAKPFLKDTEFGALADDSLVQLIGSVQKSLHRLDELPEKLKPFSAHYPPPDEDARQWLASDGAKTVIPAILDKWKSLDEPDADALLVVVNEAGKAVGVKGKDLWMPLRVAMTGMTAGPELRVILAHLGYKEAINRLSKM